MRVLVVGGGGREHALCWAIGRSPLCDELYCAPGNAGIDLVAECVPVGAEDVEGIVDFALDAAVDFVVVGPEAPLAAGLVDALAEAKVKAFGPSRAAAVIEGSKGFTKDLCARFGIPTADFARFDEADAAKSYIRAQGAPIVVKADGLAAGKGVAVCHNTNEAFAAIDHIMTEQAYGRAGDEVVIEALLEGEEASFFALVDGERALPLVSAQDHKRLHDGDEGPNTGGMGAYSPAPVMTEEMEAAVMERIIEPTVKGMVAEGRPYQGVLYAGLMITADGPKLLEYNVRFGDPECQPLLMRLESDLLEALLAAAEGRLDAVRLRWRTEAALLVVLAAKGYPGAYKRGSEIRGLERAAALEDVMVFHAGTRAEGGRILADGGRVLGIGALAADVAAARRRAYEAVGLIDWPEGVCRTDIGWQAAGR